MVRLALPCTWNEYPGIMNRSKSSALTYFLFRVLSVLNFEKVLEVEPFYRHPTACFARGVTALTVQPTATKKCSGKVGNEVSRKKLWLVQRGGGEGGGTLTYHSARQHLRNTIHT